MSLISLDWSALRRIHGDVTHSILAPIALLAVAAALSCSQAPSSSRNPADAAHTLEPWPFTIDAVVLSCVPAETPAGVSESARQTLRRHGSRVFVETPDGHRFAVNGTARSEAPLMTGIQAQPDTRALIELGLGLCRGDRGGSLRLEAPTEPNMQEPTAAPNYRVEDGGYRDIRYFIAEAEETVDGVRPKLTLSCGPGRAPMIMLDLARGPRTAPPLRGVYATFRVGPAQSRQEMSWGTEGDWTLRSGDDRVADTQLAAAILEHGEVTFTGDQQFMPNQTLTWDFSNFDRALLLRHCG